ncbi:MAG: hypothetical protein ACSHX3_09095 [Litorimonas sp.]
MKTLSELALWFLLQLKTRWPQLALVLFLSAALFVFVKVFGVEAILRQHAELQNLSFTEKTFIGAILFVWSCILLMTFVPLGTVTILIGGYLLGVGAGFIQFGSTFVASAVLYRAFDYRARRYSIEDFTDNRWILSLFALVQNKPVVTGCLLRIIPVIPSAACVFISKIMDISFRDMMKSTAAAGWIRPVFFAYVGSTAATLTAATVTMLR